MKYTDHTLMPFGKHKGKSLSNTPADYLLWLYREGLQHEPLKNYIEENREVLEAEEKRIIHDKKVDFKFRNR